MFAITAKIRRMSRRRQKIAIAKRIRAELDAYMESGVLLNGKLQRVVIDRHGATPHIDVVIQPVVPVQYISFKATICP